LGGAGTLALIGDLKNMNTKFIKAAIFTGYGVTMFMGVGIPIPVIDEEMVEYLKVKDEDIYVSISDYSVQRRNKPTFGKVNYRQLREGKITINKREVPTGSISSYQKAREIAILLKKWIKDNNFLLTSPVSQLPASGSTKPLDIVNEEEI
jgi:uncharacterized protein (DUF39 family)